MFYDEHIVEEQRFGDAMCRGTAWAGNITLEVQSCWRGSRPRRAVQDDAMKVFLPF